MPCVFIFICFMCVSTCPHNISIYHMCAWCPGRSGEVTGSPGTGVMYGCECREVSLGSLQEQQLLLTLETSL